MKKNLQETSLKRSVTEYRMVIELVITIIWIMIASVIGYHIFGLFVKDDLPNEKNYQKYENIIRQTSKEELSNIKKPRHTKVSQQGETVIVSNTLTGYSVTGKSTGAEFVREENKGKFIFTKIFFGGIIFGVGLVGIMGGSIIYRIVHIKNMDEMDKIEKIFYGRP